MKTLTCTLSVGLILITAVLIIFVPVSAIIQQDQCELNTSLPTFIRPDHAAVFIDDSTALIIGNLSAPITHADMDAIEKYIQSKHICENGPTNGALMYNLRPEVTRRFWDDSDNTVIDGVIAAYGYTIRNRTIYQYSAVIPSTRQSDIQNKNYNEAIYKAKSWFYSLPENTKPIPVTDSDNAIYSFEGVGDNEDQPYGAIHDKIELERSEYYNNDKQMVVGIRVHNKVEPGSHAWASGWDLDKYSIKHDYSSTTVSNHGLYGYSPTDNKKPSSTVSVSIGFPKSASIGWSYSLLDVDQTNDSSTTNKYARWIFVVNSGKNLEHAAEPGSVTFFDVPAKGDYIIGSMTDDATFTTWTRAHSTQASYDLGITVQ